MSVSGESSKGEESSSNRVQVPDYLQDFFSQAMGGAGDALGNIFNMSNQDVVADMNPDQMRAMEMMRGFGGSEPFQTAMSQFMNTAQGNGSPLDPELMQRLSGEGFNLNDYINDGRSAVGFTETPGARDQLNRTAQGDYLFGGDGFNAAVDASVRSAMPHIASAFGRTAGGVGSGLASSAVGQSAIDAFAGQYGQERRNQLGAANSLESGGRADRNAWLGFGEGGANRAFQGDSLLANIGDRERGRQMDAAGMLPALGMMDQDMLMQVGDLLQNQSQREIDGPMQAQLQALMAALRGVPIESLLGSDQTGDWSQQGGGFNMGMPGDYNFFDS